MPAPQMNYKKLRRQLDDLGKAPFNNYVDKMRGEGSKMSVFVRAQGMKTVHAGGGRGSKNGKILSK